MDITYLVVGGIAVLIALISVAVMKSTHGTPYDGYLAEETSEEGLALLGNADLSKRVTDLNFLVNQGKMDRSIADGQINTIEATLAGRAA